MADYTVSAGHKALGAWNLTAGQVDKVIFTDNVSKAVVINEGPGDVWCTTDGVDPVIPGAHVSTNALRVPAGFYMDVILGSNSDEVRLRSSGTPSVSVQLEK